MKLGQRLFAAAVGLLMVGGLATSSQATTLVSNVWNTGVRTYPASPTYSEMGVDSNSSSDLESAWFRTGAMDSSVGHLYMTNGVTSSSFTTYFTDEANPVTLAIGDSLMVKWVFTTGTMGAGNTSTDFRLAVVDSPLAARLTTDGTPGNAVYPGYAMFMNMNAGSLQNSAPFSLRERTATSTGFLSASGGWSSSLTNGAPTGTAGYANNTQYAYEMTLTRTASGLDIVSTMTGAGLGTSGSLTVSYSDTTPSSYVYDTFGIRNGSAAATANFFDTSLFQVDFIAIPEPSTVMLVVAGLGLMFVGVRRRL